jgi:hypothetical protein
MPDQKNRARPVSKGVRCYTRALKNARYLQSVAPKVFKKGRLAEGFGTGIPLELLRVLHRTRHDSPLLRRHKDIADVLKKHPIPLPGRTARAPLFNGVLHFAQVTFTTGGGNLVVPTADMNTIVQYAQHAVVPINEYAKQYGQNSVSVSPNLIIDTINVPSGSFGDSDLDGWVNQIASANSLGATDAVFIVFPPGLTGTGTNTSAIGDNSGFHFKANISYVAAGVFHQGLTLQDVADVYAMVVSHETAELVVDPNGDLSNPEVCDPCDINCSNLTRIYFDASNNFLGANQASPPGGFAYNYYICAIVTPDGASSCPASAADCQYAPVAPNFQFIIDKSTYGQDEVDVLLPGTASYLSAYWLAIDGFDASELGFNQASDLNNLNPNPKPTVTATLDPTLNSGLTSAQISAISANLPGVNQLGPAPIVAQDSSLNQPLQRFLYPFTVSFNNDNAFAQLLPDQVAIITLNAEMTVGSINLSASANIELTKGENPYFVDVDPTNPTQPSWLSFDLRFLTVKVPSGKTAGRFGASLGTDPSGAPGFIAQVIQNLNTNTNLSGDSFDNLTQDEESSALEFLQQDNSGNAAFNFALARVRLRGKTPGAQAIATRVFFRLFQAQTTSSDYNTGTTYRLASDGVHNGHKIPLLGVQNDQNGVPEYVTIPCFATARNNLTQPANMADMTDPPNVQTINVVPDVEVDTYFGCWLDVNQPQQQFLPMTPPPNNQGGLDGPWSGPQPFSINQVITRAPHQCLIAEINYDDTPIPGGASSSTSDKLAQRNIAWIDGPNPGEIDSRRMPHPIEIRPTPSTTQTADELMILWGATPKGSTASLFLPAINSADILSLANSMYPSHQIAVVDPHTVQCPASGSTFIPIPAGTARNAGLLTVDLPTGIKKGDVYNILVRQLTEDTYTPPPPIQRGKSRAARQNLPPGAYAWRNVLGAFEFAIVISTKQQLLYPEERLLAWLRWIQLTIPLKNRWYPVFQRYVDQIAGRVVGFGGNPIGILPSPTGDVPHHPVPKPPQPKPGDHDKTKLLEFTGKVIGLSHDRFGDFNGFLLLTECGEERSFDVREHQVAHLIAKAWEERTVLSVLVECHEPHWPVKILVRRAPEPFQH